MTNKKKGKMLKMANPLSTDDQGLQIIYCRHCDRIFYDLQRKTDYYYCMYCGGQLK